MWREIGTVHDDPETGCAQHRAVVASVANRDAPLRAERVDVLELVPPGCDASELGVDARGDGLGCAERVSREDVQLELVAKAFDGV